MTILTRYMYLIAPVAGWLVAQAIKYGLSLRQDGLQWNDFTRSGGMPSSHASFMAALATIIGFNMGFDSALFGLAFALTAIICYDATGVRRTTGEQTLALREIIAQQHLKLKTTVHEARGHTLAQVLWGIVTGLIVALILHQF